MLCCVPRCEKGASAAKSARRRRRRQHPHALCESSSAAVPPPPSSSRHTTTTVAANVFCFGGAPACILHHRIFTYAPAFTVRVFCSRIKLASVRVRNAFACARARASHSFNRRGRTRVLSFIQCYVWCGGGEWREREEVRCIRLHVAAIVQLVAAAAARRKAISQRAQGAEWMEEWWQN